MSGSKDRGLECGMFLNAICLLYNLSLRQVQLWSLGFAASLHAHTNRFLLTFPPSITLSLCLPVPPAPSQTHTHTQTHTHWNKHTFQLNPSSAWWMLLPFNFNYAVLLQLARKPLCAQATSGKWWLNYKAEKCEDGCTRRLLHWQTHNMYATVNVYGQNTHTHTHAST